MLIDKGCKTMAFYSKSFHRFNIRLAWHHVIVAIYTSILELDIDVVWAKLIGYDA